MEGLGIESWFVIVISGRPPRPTIEHSGSQVVQPESIAVSLEEAAFDKQPKTWLQIFDEIACSSSGLLGIGWGVTTLHMLLGGFGEVLWSPFVDVSVQQLLIYLDMLHVFVDPFVV